MSKKLRRLLRRLARMQTQLLAVGLGVSLTAFGLQVAEAATITVTSNADSGGECLNAPTECTLRKAIEQASAGDTITFDLSVTHITLTTGQLPINQSLTIDGDRDNNGTSDVTIDGGAVNGAGGSRIFNISTSTVTLDGLTLQNGRVSDAGSHSGRGDFEFRYLDGDEQHPLGQFGHQRRGERFGVAAP